MFASSICITNPRQLSLPHQSATWISPNLCVHIARMRQWHNPSMLICNPSPPPLPPHPTQFKQGSSSWPTRQLAVGCLHLSRLSQFDPVTLFFSLSLLLPYHHLLSLPLLSHLSPTTLLSFPPSSCLCLLPPCLSLSLILLCGGFAVGSPRHEWSISRSPGGSGPYNSVQWAWIVSQSTQEKPLCKHCHFVGCILTV